MTKQIEDELGLPRLQDALAELAAQNGELEANEEVEQMANALQHVSSSALKAEDPMGVTEHEIEADDIYKQAMKAHKDLFDLGFNIESKHAGANAFAPSAKMLEIALKASQSKALKKMEAIKLLMDKEAHEKDMGKNVEDGEIIDSGSSILANRNDIMDKIRKGEI
jgi:hypothetical protein